MQRPVLGIPQVRLPGGGMLPQNSGLPPGGEVLYVRETGGTLPNQEVVYERVGAG